MGKYSKQAQWNLGRSIFVANTFHFFYSAGRACLLPVLTLYFREIGLSASQVGILFGVKALAWLISSPIWIYIHKRKPKTRVILCCSLFVMIAMNLAMTLFQPQNNRIDSNCQFQNGFSRENNHTEMRNFTISKTTVTQPTLYDEQLSTNFASTMSSTSITTNHEGNINSKNKMKFLLTTTKPPPTTRITQTTNPTTFSSSTLSLTTTTTLLPPVESILTTPTEESSSSIKTDVVGRFNNLLVGDVETNVDTTPTTKTLSTSTFRTTVLETTKTLPTNTIEQDRDFIEADLAKLNTYELAQVLYPEMESVGYTSRDVGNIRSFIAQYEVTKNWPQWKQSRLLSLIINFLSRSQKKRHASKEQHGIAKRDVISDTSNEAKIREDLNSTAKILKNEIFKLANDILPLLQVNHVTFMCMLIMLGVGELISAPVELISDDALYELLDELDNLTRYGAHRLWGMVGTSIMGITLAIIISQLPCVINGSIHRFNVHFYMFAALLGIAFLVVFCYPTFERNNSSRRYLTSGHSGCLWICSGQVCSSCRHFLLVITIFIVGTTQAPVQNFILWEVQDMGGPSEIIYGSYISAMALSELAASLCGKRIMRIIKPSAVAPVSMLVVMLQLITYSFMVSPWIVVPLQLFNILGYSFLWTVVTYHTSTVMTSNMNSSDTKRLNEVHVFARSSQQRAMRTTYVMVYQGLAFSTGSMVSGILYDGFGDLAPVLLASAIMVAVWAFIFTCYQGCCLRKQSRKKFSQLISDEDAEEDDDGYVSNNHYGSNGSKSKLHSSYRSHAKKQRKKPERRRLTMDSSSGEEELFGTDWLSAAMRKDNAML